MILSGCAGAPESESEAPPSLATARCSTMECFREREIRDVQLLDADTMVVFIGPQRCAFRMELDGPYCGSAGFTVDFDLDRRSSVLGGQQPLICIYDRPYIRDALDNRSAEGVMPGGRGPRPSNTDSFDRCRVEQIIPLSDDELLETYVEAGAQAPLPPVGSGEISVENEEEEGETQGDATADPDPQARTPAQVGAGEPGLDQLELDAS
jgi:hypothetical protein